MELERGSQKGLRDGFSGFIFVLSRFPVMDRTFAHGLNSYLVSSFPLSKDLLAGNLVLAACRVLIGYFVVCVHASMSISISRDSRFVPSVNAYVATIEACRRANEYDRASALFRYAGRH